ncbi:hypothetical protein ACSBR2_002395 [Camellia fascicularis]
MELVHLISSHSLLTSVVILATSAQANSTRSVQATRDRVTAVAATVAPIAPPATSIPISSISIDLPLHLPSQNHHSMLTRSKTKAVSTCFLASTAASTEDVEPSTYQEAAQSSTWQAAMLDEFQALQKQATWSLVPLPPGKSAIGSKWVYTNITVKSRKLMENCLTSSC